MNVQKRNNSSNQSKHQLVVAYNDDEQEPRRILGE